MEIETIQGTRLPWLMGNNDNEEEDDSNEYRREEPRLLMFLSTDHLVKDEHSRSSSNSGRRDFSCKTCNKKFPTFQALGGHRTAHNRIPAATTTSSSSSRCCPVVMDGNTKKRKRRRVHSCSICGMSFNAGQALGGHMRRHRGFMATVAAAAAIATDAGDVCLDLSLAPPNSNDVGFLKLTRVGF